MRASLACVSLSEDSKEEESGEEEEEAAAAATPTTTPTGAAMREQQRRCRCGRARAAGTAFVLELLLTAIEHIAAWRLVAEAAARSIVSKGRNVATWSNRLVSRASLSSEIIFPFSFLLPPSSSQRAHFDSPLNRKKSSTLFSLRCVRWHKRRACWRSRFAPCAPAGLAFWG